MMHQPTHGRHAALPTDDDYREVPQGYDKQGTVIDLSQMAALKAGEDGERYLRVGLDYVDDAIEVSTVWVGLDMRLDDGLPLIFETVVFSPTRQEVFGRYATEKLAREGHQRIVAMLGEQYGRP